MQFSLSGCPVAHPLQLLSSAVKVLVKDNLCGRACTPSLVHPHLSCHVTCSASILSNTWMLIGTLFVMLHVLNTDSQDYFASSQSASNSINRFWWRYLQEDGPWEISKCLSNYSGYSCQRDRVFGHGISTVHREVLQNWLAGLRLCVGQVCAIWTGFEG